MEVHYPTTKTQEIGKNYVADTYYLADFGFNIAGGVASLRNAGKVTKFEFIGRFHGYDKAKVYAVTKAGDIVREGFLLRQPWELRVTGHTLEAVLAGVATWDSLDSAAAQQKLDVRLGGMSAQDAGAILKEVEQ